MPVLVGNLEDRFSRDAAQISSNIVLKGIIRLALQSAFYISTINPYSSSFNWPLKDGAPGSHGTLIGSHLYTWVKRSNSSNDPKFLDGQAWANSKNSSI